MTHIHCGLPLLSNLTATPSSGTQSFKIKAVIRHRVELHGSCVKSTMAPSVVPSVYQIAKCKDNENIFWPLRVKKIYRGLCTVNRLNHLHTSNIMVY